MNLMRVYFSIFFLLLCIPFAHAQGQVAALQKAVTRQAFNARQLAQLSQISNQLLQTKLRAFFRPAPTPSPIQFNFSSLTNAAGVFRIQRHEDSAFPASAFAVEVDGHLFGVTAGHVMYNSARLEDRQRLERLRAEGQEVPPFTHLPFARFAKENGDFLTLPIANFRLSNIFGTDVAVFEIPSQARPYVQPLPMSATLPQVGQTASISGFAADQPLHFAKEEVLFSSIYRLILRNSNERATTGMCGSPVTSNGQVVGIYVGFVQEDKIQNTSLFSLTQPVKKENETLPDIHWVAPISLIMPLVDEMLGTTHREQNLILKAAAHPVAVLRPEERILSVSLIRNAEKIGSVSAQELTDPEHLEEFFELQPNDILRIHIESDANGLSSQKIFFYDVNVSTGQVIRSETSAK